MVTGARVTLLPMCKGVGQASHIMPPLSTQQWWVLAGTKNRELWMALAAEKSAEFSPEEMRPYTREFQYQGCKFWSLLNSMGYQTTNIHIYIHINIWFRLAEKDNTHWSTQLFTITYNRHSNTPTFELQRSIYTCIENIKDTQFQHTF